MKGKLKEGGAPKTFDGEEGRRRLIEALASQRFVNGDLALAGKIAELGKVYLVPAKKQIITQGDDTHSLFAILSGTFEIVVNGKSINRRFANDTVGEMAALQPSQARSASVVADEPGWVVELDEPHVAELGAQFPAIWRYFARDLARRLLERNRLLRAPRDRVRVLIISSAEALPVARAIQDAFEHDPFLVYPWSDGIFKVTHYPLDSLEDELDRSDFAIAIASPDDVTASRKKRTASPRDNVIFELGYFMGRLGRHRAVLLEPVGTKVKLPSDFDGLKPIPYKYVPGPDVIAELAPTCNKLRKLFNDLGVYT